VAVIDDRQRAVGSVGCQPNRRRARVQCIGDDFGEDRLFERTRVCVAEVLKQVLEIDSGLTHGGILSHDEDGQHHPDIHQPAEPGYTPVPETTSAAAGFALLDPRLGSSHIRSVPSQPPARLLPGGPS